jgi:hypothetical protein
MGMNHIWIAVLVLVSAIPALSRTLSEAELYRRCYAHLIGESPLLNDTNLVAIKSGSKSGTQACNNLLDRMTINPNDSQGRLNDPSDLVAVKGMRNLYNVTGQFVASKRFEGTITNYFEDYASGEDILDNTAIALAYTENILNDNREFKDLFNMTTEPKAARVMDPMYPTTFTVNTVFGGGGDMTPVYSARSRHGQRFYSDASATIKVNPDAVPYSIMNSDNTTWADQSFTSIAVGELVGISYSHANETLNRAGGIYGGSTLGFNIHSNVAKGITGLRPYVAASTNWSDNTRPNLEYMQRRLSQSYLKDFLCREVPVVRETDILNMVSTSSTALAFRKASSCVRCHATLDPMAASFRNLVLIKSGNRMQNVMHRYFPMPHKSDVVSGFTAEAGWPAVKDTNFYKRPAKGRFYFRTYDGKLVDRTLESYDDLSTAFGETDDAYICYAKKMFKHFTGVEVRMFDAGDAANSTYMSSLTTEDWEYRNFVVKAGLNLKKHQKAKELIKEIMQSPFYKKSNMGKD